MARRAYQAAVGDSTSSFFFVRGGTASSPFSLTNVELGFSGIDKPILFVKHGDELPKIKAEITYTGTGRLKGRWEVVLPGKNRRKLAIY